MATWHIEKLASGERAVFFSDGKQHVRSSAGQVRPEVLEVVVLDWVTDQAKLADKIVMSNGGESWMPWGAISPARWGRQPS